MTSKTTTKKNRTKKATSATNPTAKSPANKKRQPKKSAPRKAGPQTLPSATLAEIGDGYLAHIEQAGKTVSTVASYRADLGMAYRHFGADTPARAITAAQVTGMFSSLK